MEKLFVDIEAIKTQLKKEFIGIDYVIDHIVDSTRGWVKNDRITSPNIINVWGMTGTGKTKLITRMLELMNFKDDMFYFNMINTEDFKHTMMDLEDIDLEKSISDASRPRKIFILDEFQNAYTIDPTGARVDRKELSKIWDLLDSGLIHKKDYGLGFWMLAEIFQDLERIEQDQSLLEKETKDCGLSCMRYYTYKSLCDKTPPKRKLSWAEFNTAKVKDVIDVYEIKTTSPTLKTLDFSNSLIFVIGNLDGLYRCANIMESEINPDYIYERFKDVTFQDAKKVLSGMFFPEQISRLGNNHICYKPFSKKVYYELIERYLKDVNKRYAVDYTFDKSFVDMFYRESVFPTQGVRPILSTIKYIYEQNIDTMIEQHGTTGKVYYKYNKIVIGDLKIKPCLVNTSKKVDKKSSDYRLACIHEAGHAFVYFKLNNEAPPNVVIKTNSNHIAGFTEIRNKTYSTEKDYKNKLAVGLGGLVAEEIVLGVHTDGCGGDMNDVTVNAEHLVRSYGMRGQLAVTKAEYIGNDITNPKNTLDEVEVLLQEAKEVARKVIEDNMDDYRKLVAELYDKVIIDENNFKKLFPNTNKVNVSDKFETFLSMGKKEEDNENN
jgi:hypothetical protein